MKNNIYKTKNKRLIIALLLSIGFILGIPMIIFGFINGYILLGVLGIVLTVLGFYGAPISWIAYSSMNFRITLYEQIIIDKIFSVKLLSETNNKKEKEVINEINYLISKRFLRNFIIDNNTYLIDVTDKKELNKEIFVKNNDIKTVKCNNCGAVLDITRGFGQCPYCGLFLNDRESNNG